MLGAAETLNGNLLQRNFDQNLFAQDLVCVPPGIATAIVAESRFWFQLTVRTRSGGYQTGVFYRNRFEVHRCLLSCFCRKNRRMMNFSPESINHRFITYSDSLTPVLHSAICSIYLQSI
jgi:hypothetical protein